jgi:hypothetical protein
LDVDAHNFDDRNICGLGFICNGSKAIELRKEKRTQHATPTCNDILCGKWMWSRRSLGGSDAMLGIINGCIDDNCYYYHRFLY